MLITPRSRIILLMSRMPWRRGGGEGGLAGSRALDMTYEGAILEVAAWGFTYNDGGNLRYISPCSKFRSARGV